MSKNTILRVIKFWLERTPRFSGVALVKYVRDELDRPYLYDSTILRQMRRLRKKGWVIKCIDRRKSLYLVSVIGE